MSSNDDRYGWYQRDEQERRQRRLEQEREAEEDQRAWEAYLAEVTKRGQRGAVERLLNEMRSHTITLARSRGKTLKEAKVDGEFILAKMKKLLSSLD